MGAAHPRRRSVHLGQISPPRARVRGEDRGRREGEVGRGQKVWKGGRGGGYIIAVLEPSLDSGEDEERSARGGGEVWS
jgi:hypothetical protein